MKKSKILTLSILLILVSPQLLSLTAIADEMAVTASTEERRTESSEEESSDGSSVSKKKTHLMNLAKRKQKPLQILQPLLLLRLKILLHLNLLQQSLPLKLLRMKIAPKLKLLKHRLKIMELRFPNHL